MNQGRGSRSRRIWVFWPDPDWSNLARTGLVKSGWIRIGQIWLDPDWSNLAKSGLVESGRIRTKSDQGSKYLQNQTFHSIFRPELKINYIGFIIVEKTYFFLKLYQYNVVSWLFFSKVGSGSGFFSCKLGPDTVCFFFNKGRIRNRVNYTRIRNLVMNNWSFFSLSI